MGSVLVPRSMGRLTEAAGPTRTPVRRSEASWSGPESTAMAGEDEVTDRAAVRCVARGARQFGSELAEQVVIDSPGDDRDDSGVAGIAGGGSWPE